MNAYMNIQIRVLSAQAASQLRQVQGQIAGIQAQATTASAATAGLFGARAMSPMVKFGNQLQWTGRQLQYNFTLPILLAGAAASKFALENEKAFTRIVKVYGDASMAQQQITNETNALKKAFVALSNHYGVHQKEVLDIAAAWAAAGASGRALAEDVQLTLQTMILGEMKAAEATEALIAIQAQYNQSTEELAQTIHILNMVENQTGISLQGLVQGMSRAAGVAAAAGIDVRHLAAMLAAMTPAAGTAAQAGNALKTIISRLFAPTREAAEVLGLMGINVQSVAWQSLNGSERIEKLATSFSKLSGSTKSIVSSVVASRFQINKFNVLMESVAASTDEAGRAQSYYERALESTADKQKVFEQAQKELNQVLESNPQKLKQIWTILENGLADAIQPLIPVILMAADVLRQMVTAFTGLPPEIQKIIGVMVLFLALFGPLLRYLGSTITLIYELRFAAAALLVPFKVVGGMLAGLGSGAILGKVNTGLLAVRAGMFAAAAGIFRFIGSLKVLGLLVPPIAAMLANPFANFLKFALVGTFTSLGKTLTIIWGSTFVAMRTIANLGLLNVWQAFAVVFARNVVATMRLLSTTLVGLWALTSRALLGAMAAWAVGASNIITLFFLNIGKVFAAGWAAALLVTRQAITLLLFRLYALPILLVRNLGPMLIAALRGVAIAAVTAFTSPWGLAIAAVAGIIYAFRDQIGQIISNIVDYFNKLPGGIAGALLAVVQVVKQAALTVYGWLSYLNPFARHSPSLVDNVRAGMAVVRAEIMSVTTTKSALRQSAADLQRYGQIIASMKKQMEAAQRAEDRAAIGKINPGALGAFDALNRDLAALNRALAGSAAAVRAQEQVVASWEAKLNAANRALDKQRDKLDQLQDRLNTYQDLLSEAQDRLSTFASTPIKGMQAMSDKIFENSMAQKALRLEMLKMDEAVGGFDKLNDRVSRLNGEMELARGMQNSLRAKGAGSDILGAFDDQVRQIEEQKNALESQIGPYEELQRQMDELARKGEILDLENSLAFDPLTRQIEQAANAMKEMPFDQIMAGIQGAKSDIDRYSDAVDAATEAVKRQQAVVDAAEKARDAIAARYDQENEKLQRLKDTYTEIRDMIGQVEDALQSMTQSALDAIRRQEEAARKAAARRSAKKLTPGGEAFMNSLGAEDFADVTGSGGLGRQGPAGDQSALIDQFTQDLAKQTADMFKAFDIFGPIKDKWNQFVEWLRGATAPIRDFFKQAFAGVDFMGPLKNIDFSFLGKAKDVAVDFFRSLIDWGGKVWDLIGPDIILLGRNLWEGIKGAWEKIKPVLVSFKDLLRPLGEAFQNIWTIIKPILALLIGLFLGLASTLLHTLAKVIKPVFEAIGGILAGLLTVIRGVVKILIGIFTLDFKMIWSGIVDIVSGTVKAVVELIVGLGKTLWALIKGIVEGVVNFFKWLWKVLVGSSIVPDIVNGIVNWIKKLGALPKWIYDNWLKPFYDKLVSWWGSSVKPKIQSVADGITNILKGLGKLPGWIYDNTWKPIYDKVSGWYSNTLKPKVTGIKDGLITILKGLGMIPQWLFDNAFKPIWTKLNSVWESNLKPLGNRMIRGFANIFNTVGNAIVKGINIGISAVNKLIDGLNWIGSHVPGLSFSIGKLGTAVYNPWSPPQFATGGWLPTTHVGGGFKTNGIRAIVGEGNPSHPEYVIPTDPKYRKRALGLLASAAREVGIAFESGGILGKIKDAVISSGSTIARGAVNKVMDPIKDAVNGMLTRIDNRMFLRDLLRNSVNKMFDWGKKVDGALPTAGGRINPRLGPALDFARMQSGKPYLWGGVGPGGYDCSGFMSAITNYIQNKYPYMRRFATGNFPTSEWAPGMGAFSIGYFRGNPGHMAGTLNGVNVESAGGVGVRVGASARGAKDSMFGGRLFHLKGYARGGKIGDPAWDLMSPLGQYYLGDVFRSLALRSFDTGGWLRPGLTLAYNGTGSPERIMTKKQEQLWMQMAANGSGGGTTEHHWHGDFVFPNIRSGEDAEDFIRNLEVIVGGR